MNWGEIKSLKDNYIKEALSKVSFKENDCFEKIDDKRRGRIKSIWFDEGKGLPCIYVNYNKISNIGWISVGDKNYFHGDEIKLIQKINNPYDENKVNELYEEIDKIENKPMTSSDRKRNMQKIENKILELKNQCIHLWGEGIKTGNKHSDFSNGEKEEYKYYCEVCGMEGYSYN